jgi:hypothetical protein
LQSTFKRLQESKIIVQKSKIILQIQLRNTHFKIIKAQRAFFYLKKLKTTLTASTCSRRFILCTANCQRRTTNPARFTKQTQIAFMEQHSIVYIMVCQSRATRKYGGQKKISGQQYASYAKKSSQKSRRLQTAFFNQTKSDVSYKLDDKLPEMICRTDHNSYRN